MSIDDRVISMGEGLAAIPERLLLAHARGEVLFICGAGISQPALPGFRELVKDIYKTVDPVVHDEISKIPDDTTYNWEIKNDKLNDKQKAEVKRFIKSDFDVVLGMLERRMEGRTDLNSVVRNAVIDRIRSRQTDKDGKLAVTPIHQSIVRLSDRGGASAIVTTNFDLLLEGAAKQRRTPLQTYSLNSIPRPTRNLAFAGVFHIHGALGPKYRKISDLIITDQDFGDAYLRQRNVPDFIYDLTRLFHLVLVGYSANDPPMRYLLNAIASDENRFPDIKKRFVFTPASATDPVALEDWKARGILPIEYDNPDNRHDALRATLERWAKLSAHNKQPFQVKAELRRIVKKPHSMTEFSDRDLFDHLFRRDRGKRAELAAFVSELKADISWLIAIADVCREDEQDQ
jgi:NAD-dependent SIR2 family protein deacetylase